MRTYSILMALLMSTIPVSLAHSAAGWTSVAAAIVEVNQQPDSGVGSEMVFITLSDGTNPSGCSTANSFYFLVDTDRRKRIFTMLLGAQLASRTVRLYVTGSCHPTWGSAQINGAVIE